MSLRIGGFNKLIEERSLIEKTPINSGALEANKFQEIVLDKSLG